MIEGLSTINGEVNIIQKALTLANLNAWNAQIINKSFESIPRIEPRVNRPGYSIIEVRDNDKKLNIFLIEKITELIVLVTDIFGRIHDMDNILCEDYEEFSVVNFEMEEQKIEAVTYAMTRTLDSLTDALLYGNLFLERHQS